MRLSPVLVAIHALILFAACGSGDGGASGSASGVVATAAPVLPEGVPPYAVKDAESCAECHAIIVAEWRESMHAHSMLEDDPVYKLMYDKAVKVIGEGAKTKCKGCHYPDWADAALGAGLPVEGVSCAVCHKFDPKHPVEAKAEEYTYALGEGDARSMCLACHAELKSPDGHPVCTTGAEADEAKACGPPCMQTCITCHMEEVEGVPTSTKPVRFVHFSHRIPGGRVPAYLAGKANINFAIIGKGKKREVEVKVVPKEVGHGLPTGNPMRFVTLLVQALDADGNVLWQNLGEARPPFDHPEALFMRVFSDADGNKPVPPFLAAGPSEDSRFGPLETRVVRYPVPPGTDAIVARLEYNLAPAKVLKAAGITGELAGPRLIAESRLEL